MKKTFFFMSLLLGLCVSVAFTACGSDDDDDASSNPLVGTWCTENVTKGKLVYTEITYNKDLTCTWREYRSGRTTVSDSDTGTYKVEGNKLSIWWESEREYWVEGPWTTIFSISGDKMTTTEANGTVWTKK